MAKKEEKIYTIEQTKSRRFGTPSKYYQTGTLPELVKAYSYTLGVGKSYETEKGNAKINMNPKTVEKLVDMLGKAKDNAAADGYSGCSFRVMAEGEEPKA